jgi:hypothetical protein
MSDGTALGRVFAFSLNGDGVVAEDVQVAFSVGLLEELSAFSGRGDWVKHAGIGDARLGVVGDELISVCGDTNAWITRSFRHDSLSLQPSSFVNLFAMAASAWISREDAPIESATQIERFVRRPLS